jgi:hypothetical protein
MCTSTRVYTSCTFCTRVIFFLDLANYICEPLRNFSDFPQHVETNLLFIPNLCYLTTLVRELSGDFITTLF